MEPKPKAPPKTDPLEGLDYTVGKDGGKWKAECLGVTAYGTTKKQALFMLSEELNGFGAKGEPRMPEVTGEQIMVRGVPMLAVAPVAATVPKPEKREAYSIDDAELLWACEYPNKPDLLRLMFQERIELKTEVDRIKGRIEEINKSLLGFFDRQGVESVKWEDWTIAKVKGSNVTLDKEALVLAGVPVETITACTKRKEYVTVRVTGPKGGE